MSSLMKAITTTVVFEASAVNRDENIANNVQSLKKLRRKDGVYTYFSRSSMRHHIFNALVKKHGWKPARVTKDRDVIQFDIFEESIATSEELDFFGYMRTGDINIARKAPVGMTKAVSLESWEGDMAFYANHDLVERARKSGQSADPNPFAKEEHFSHYKYSVTVDLERVGKEVHILPKEIKVKNVRKKLEEALDRFLGIELKELIRDRVFSGGEGKAEFEDMGEAYRIVFDLNEEEKKRRLKEFFDVIINGFEIHSSTESWSASPVFVIVASTKMPVTLFNPYVQLNDGKVDLRSLSQVVEGNTNILDYRIWATDFIVGEAPELEGKICGNLKDLNVWIERLIEGSSNNENPQDTN